MAKYMLLIRGGETLVDPTPEEMQQAIQPYIDWSNRLRAEGRHLGGEELAESGPVLRSRNGAIVVDGPYAETKESIGGYFMVQAVDEADVIAVATSCPVLLRGGAVEIRQVIEH